MPATDSGNFSSHPCIVYLHVEKSIDCIQASKATKESVPSVGIKTYYFSNHFPLNTVMKLKSKRKSRVSNVLEETEPVIVVTDDEPSDVASQPKTTKKEKKRRNSLSSDPSYDFSLESYRSKPFSSSSDVRTPPALRSKADESASKDSSHSSDEHVSESDTGNKKTPVKTPERSGSKKFKVLTKKKKLTTKYSNSSGTNDSVSESENTDKDKHRKAPILIRVTPSESASDSDKHADKRSAEKKLLDKKGNRKKSHKSVGKKTRSPSSAAGNKELSDSGSSVLPETGQFKKKQMSKQSKLSVGKKVPVVVLEQLSINAIKKHCATGVSAAASDQVPSIESTNKGPDQESSVGFEDRIEKVTTLQKEESAAKNVEKWLQNVSVDNTELEQLSNSGFDERLSVAGSSSSSEKQGGSDLTEKAKKAVSDQAKKLMKKTNKLSSRNLASVPEMVDSVSTVDVKEAKKTKTLPAASKRLDVSAVQNDAINEKFPRVMLERLPPDVVNKHTGEKPGKMIEEPLFAPISDESEFSVSIPTIHTDDESEKGEIVPTARVDKGNYEEKQTTEKVRADVGKKDTEKSSHEQSKKSSKQNIQCKKEGADKVGPKLKRRRIVLSETSSDFASTESSVSHVDIEAGKRITKKPDLGSKKEKNDKAKKSIKDSGENLSKDISSKTKTDAHSAEEPSQEGNEVSPQRNIQNRQALIRINLKKQKGKKISPKQKTKQKISPKQNANKKISSVGFSESSSSLSLPELPDFHNNLSVDSPSSQANAEEDKNINKSDSQGEKGTHDKRRESIVINEKDKEKENSDISLRRSTEKLHKRTRDRSFPKESQQKNTSLRRSSRAEQKSYKISSDLLPSGASNASNSSFKSVASKAGTESEKSMSANMSDVESEKEAASKRKKSTKDKDLGKKEDKSKSKSELAKKDKNVSKAYNQGEKENHGAKRRESIVVTENDKEKEGSDISLRYSPEKRRKRTRDHSVPKESSQKNKSLRQISRAEQKSYRISSDLSLSGASVVSNSSFKSVTSKASTESEKNMSANMSDVESEKEAGSKRKKSTEDKDLGKKEDKSRNESDDNSVVRSSAKRSTHEKNKGSQKLNVKGKREIRSDVQDIPHNRKRTKISEQSSVYDNQSGRSSSASSSNLSGIYCNVKLPTGKYINVSVPDLFHMFKMSPVVVLPGVD